jgi:hypothetical protein
MSKAIKRLALAGFALTLLAASQSDANAQGRYGGYPPKYCLRAYDGAMDCAYFDRLQCQAAASGTGGDCAINSRFVGYPDPKAPRWKKVYR